MKKNDLLTQKTSTIAVDPMNYGEILCGNYNTVVLGYEYFADVFVFFLQLIFFFIKLSSCVVNFKYHFYIIVTLI